MSKFKCLITDFQGNNCSYEVNKLQKHGIDVVIADSKEKIDWIEYVNDVDAVLTRHAIFDNSVIQLMDRCKIISRYGTGYDNIDIKSSTIHNIVVTYVSDYCADEVAEHTFSLLMYSVRNLSIFFDSVVNGDWTPSTLPPVERLNGKELTIVGYGKIGKKVAKIAIALGLKVRVYDPFISNENLTGVTQFDTVEKALEGTDIVTLHLPLTPDTRHILNKKRMNLISKGGILINVSRGGLIDIDAAIKLLDIEHLNSLVLDVLEREPPDKNDVVRSHPKIILTPHVGYYSQESVRVSKEICVRNIISVLNSEKPVGPVAKQII